jgi:hypothetical protein
MQHTPWIGIAAVVAMFLLPLLPDWFFEGPRTIRHWPRRHVCGQCGAPWTDGHACAPEAGDRRFPLRYELHRVGQKNTTSQALLARGAARIVDH